MNRQERHNFLLQRLAEMYDWLASRNKMQPMTVEVTVHVEGRDWSTLGRYARNTLAEAASKADGMYGYHGIIGVAIKTVRNDCRGYNKLEVGFEEPT